MKAPSFLTAISLAAISMVSCQQKPEQADLVLLYTTDVHGAYLPFDIKRNAPAVTSMANVATYIKQQRAEHPDAVMLFDAGDMLQGQPSMYYYNFVDTTSQHLVAAIYNYLQYDAITVGNHDIEAGEKVYHDRLPQQFEMPWICANAIDQRTGEPMFPPYCIIERQGVKIAVLGMITPNIAAWLPKALWPNLEFEDMVECARHWVPIIEQEEQPDILIGLFHSGTDYTANGATMETVRNENGAVPAAINVPGFDLILCGHDHQTSIETVVNVAGDSVKVLDARTQAALVGRADIHLKLDKQTGRYQKQITTSIVSMKEYAPDAEFAAKFDYAVQEVNRYVDEPIGQLATPLYGEDGLYGPSEFSDFIHEVQLEATQADISLVSVLSAHDTVPAGPLTMRQLFTLYKYENLLFTMRMTGADVQKFLEFGFDRQFATMQSANDHLMAFEKNEKGEIEINGNRPSLLTPTFNYTSAAGIRYVVDLRKPNGQKVSILSMSDGTPFDPEREYLVALNSYQASGGGEFLSQGLGWSKEESERHIVNATPKDVRRYVSDHIKARGTITPTLRGDWEVIPQDWWKKGKERDKKLL